MRLLKQSFLALFGLAAMGISPAMAQIEQTRFDSSAFALGTLTPKGGALPRDLWANAERDAVEDLLVGVPVIYDDPAHLELLRRVMLSPGEGPRGADNALAGQKFLTAALAGFYRDAKDLAELVPGLRSEATLSQVVAFAELMDGQTDTACARGAGLQDGRSDPFWLKLRHICYVRAGEISAADLTMNLLERQGALTEAEALKFSRFGAGRDPEIGAPQTVFDWVMLQAQGKTLTQADLANIPLGIVAAVARSTAHPAAVREAALIKAMSARAIGPREAMTLLDGLPSSPLAGELVAVATHPSASLEQYEAIANMLDRAGANWDMFRARAILLAPYMSDAEPVMGYAPRADSLTLAAMINGQTSVAEKWLLALAQDVTSPSSPTRAGELLNMYAVLDPGAARRIGSYMGVGVADEAIPAVTADNAGAGSLIHFVRAGLSAAEAGSVGPATLVYLMGLNVPDNGGADGVRDEVFRWARGHADIDWLDRWVSFRARAVPFLAATADAAGDRIVDGRPVPRVKPGAN